MSKHNSCHGDKQTAYRYWGLACKHLIIVMHQILSLWHWCTGTLVCRQFNSAHCIKVAMVMDDSLWKENRIQNRPPFFSSKMGINLWLAGDLMQLVFSLYFTFWDNKYRSHIAVSHYPQNYDHFSFHAYICPLKWSNSFPQLIGLQNVLDKHSPLAVLFCSWCSN